MNTQHNPTAKAEYTNAPIAPEPKLAEELRKMPQEPLLPIEKKLVLWSVLLGLFLLGALMWVNQAFFHR